MMNYPLLKEQSMKRIVTVPNVLSLSRLVFLPLLIGLAYQERRTAFLIAFILIGSTDFFDGLIARRFNQVSDIGKQLDSFADIFFYVSVAWFIHRLHPEMLQPLTVLLYVFFGILALSFIVSSVTCKKPIMMHTFLLKMNGVLVYLLVIAAHFTDVTVAIAMILGIYIIAFIEEIIIFIRYGEVDPDTPSLLTLLKKS
ncbi:MAG: CDP-alcohol phosphatidyltransferase family protein [Acholeplasmatales bacterium]|nr:MAG: CDP-alcohol phosphatidyltransferase family protein [Acholeplasmatales bacterium]